MADKAQMLEQSTDMVPVAGTVDVAIPIDSLWDCFTQANQWPRWNPCMFWVQNHDLIPGKELVWVFEPIRWWYLYKLPARARIVEVEAQRKVTWEVTFIPGFYARHTYWLEDLGDGRTRFGSTEKAQGPVFRLLQSFWLAHFIFVRDQSLKGARLIEAGYRHKGNHDVQKLPLKDYAPSILPLAAMAAILAILKNRR